MKISTILIPLIPVVLAYTYAIRSPFVTIPYVMFVISYIYASLSKDRYREEYEELDETSLVLLLSVQFLTNIVIIPFSSAWAVILSGIHGVRAVIEIGKHEFGNALEILQRVFDLSIAKRIFNAIMNALAIFGKWFIAPLSKIFRTVWVVLLVVLPILVIVLLVRST